MADWQDLQARISGVRENEPLKNHTWFKIGGPARYFFEAHDEPSLIAALRCAAEHKLPVMVLGGGSNVLVSDRGFDGLVICNRYRHLAVDATSVSAGSGALIGELLYTCTKHGLGGMEFMAGVPGTVGGAVRGNAGAWGHGFGEVCSAVRCFRNGRAETVPKSDLRFGYRTSVFQEPGTTVLSATLELRRRAPEEIDAAVKENLAKRAQRIPSDPSAGSIFRNIELNETPVDMPRIIKALDITEEEFQQRTKYGKLPVGFLVERLNLCGATIGGARISKQHGNIIINPDGTATADDVMQLIALMKTRIRNQLGIQLREEVQLVGF